MVCFANNMLWGGNKNFIKIINKLKQTFHIGAEHSQAFNYIVIYLKQTEVNNFLERNKKDKLTEKEVTSLRGALGKINWIAGMS